MYTKTVMDHFANPRHVGTLEDADGYARVTSSVHNDVVELFIRVRDGRLADVRYRAFGCAAVIATSSMTAELAQGLTLDEAEALSEQQVIDALGGLPEQKQVCSLLAPKALRQAVARYRQHAREPGERTDA